MGEALTRYTNRFVIYDCIHSEATTSEAAIVYFSRGGTIPHTREILKRLSATESRVCAEYYIKCRTWILQINMIQSVCQTNQMMHQKG